MEQFRELEEFPGYKFGNQGTVLSLYGRPMKQQQLYSCESYYRMAVSIINKDNKKATHSVHRLIALAWIPNPENKPHIDHIDRNTTNNSISNLRWATPPENANNKGKYKTNKSGTTGLFFYKERWTINKVIMGKTYYKTFKERSEAEAYLREIIETQRFLTEEALA